MKIKDLMEMAAHAAQPRHPFPRRNKPDAEKTYFVLQVDSDGVWRAGTAPWAALGEQEWIGTGMGPREALADHAAKERQFLEEDRRANQGLADQASVSLAAIDDRLVAE